MQEIKVYRAFKKKKKKEKTATWAAKTSSPLMAKTKMKIINHRITER
jgi:hypothetical protein